MSQLKVLEEIAIVGGSFDINSTGEWVAGTDGEDRNLWFTRLMANGLTLTTLKGWKVNEDGTHQKEIDLLPLMFKTSTSPCAVTNGLHKPPRGYVIVRVEKTVGSCILYR